MLTTLYDRLDSLESEISTRYPQPPTENNDNYTRLMSSKTELIQRIQDIHLIIMEGLENNAITPSDLFKIITNFLSPNNNNNNSTSSTNNNSGSESNEIKLKIIELKEFIDIAEKEGILNNKLNKREDKVFEYRDDIENNIVKNIDLNNSHLTYDRGSKLVESKIIFHKYWVKQMYLAHKIIIPLLIFLVFFILIYKVSNK